ncbi:chemotaxis protein CheW [Microbulbifer agarilyticus]
MSGNGVETLSSTEVPTEVSSLLLPLADGQLLVPVDTLSEIIALQSPVSAFDAPDWYMGELHWRELRLPLISFEVMRGNPMPVLRSNCRIAVLSSGNPDGDLPFFAVVLQGTPRLVRVTPADLAGREGECAMGELMHVSVTGEAAVIPDLGALEEACIDYRTSR